MKVSVGLLLIVVFLVSFMVILNELTVYMQIRAKRSLGCFEHGSLVV